MEYVTDATGQTILAPAALAVAPSIIAFPAPTVTATSDSAANATPASAAVAPSAAAATVKVVGLSTLEQVESFYQAEVARVERDAAVIKRFATNVITSGKAEVASVKADAVSLAAFVKAHYGALILSHTFTAVVGFALKVFL